MFIRNQNLRETGDDHEWHPKFIDIVACLYICALILTWVTASKMFTVGGLVLNASLLVYPLNQIFGDILTEVYGFNRTRRLIWMGFVCGLIFLLVTQIAIALPPPPGYTAQEAFALINGALPRVVFASYVAYLCCEFTNSFIMSKMKIWQNADSFPLRAVASTIAAQFVDSALFFTIAFAGIVTNTELLNMLIFGWILKVTYETLALPFSSYATAKLKELEGIEHFDRYKLKFLRF